jgi:phosphoglycolate phosphatase-like HAD superfamily hydrolase
MRLTPFLRKYDTVVFDMDGVITSEQNYWNAAALTVYEMLHSKLYFGRETLHPSQLNTEEIRRHMFCDDELIRILKRKGVNSNWDLAYVTVCMSLTADTQPILSYADKLSDTILEEYANLALALSQKLHFPIEKCARNGTLWNQIQQTFQEWFLGDTLFCRQYGYPPKQPGKNGLLYEEKPIIDFENMQTLFRLLHESGKRVCTGTGRPYAEIAAPLEKWGIRQYIADDGLINYDHVIRAEHALSDNKIAQTLTKPHPYLFLRALFGERVDDEKLVLGQYDKAPINALLIVGDAGADLFAAQAMGADFAAVLTGAEGQTGRAFFEQNHATYILDSAEMLLEDENNANSSNSTN